MAATDTGELRPTQISKKYLARARASVTDTEGFDFVTDNDDVGPDRKSNEIDGFVRCALAGRNCCLHPSAMSLRQCGLGDSLPTPVAVSGAGSCHHAETRRER